MTNQNFITRSLLCFYILRGTSGDTSPPGDTLVAVLSRNLEAQRELPPTPTDQYRRGARLLMPANNDSGDNVRIQLISW